MLTSFQVSNEKIFKIFHYTDLDSRTKISQITYDGCILVINQNSPHDLNTCFCSYRKIAHKQELIPLVRSSLTIAVRHSPNYVSHNWNKHKSQKLIPSCWSILSCSMSSSICLNKQFYDTDDSKIGDHFYGNFHNVLNFFRCHRGIRFTIGFTAYYMEFVLVYMVKAPY